MEKLDFLKGKRVLIVDDEPDVLDTLQELLSMCVLSRAASFERAKDLLEKREFDLAVFDIIGVNGYELLELAVEENVVSVMLTANALSPESTAKSYRKGAAFYVPKDMVSRIPELFGEILEAKQKGKNSWSLWLQQFEDLYDRRFGPEWKEKHKDFWKEIAELDWRLASFFRGDESDGMDRKRFIIK